MQNRNPNIDERLQILNDYIQRTIDALNMTRQVAQGLTSSYQTTNVQSPVGLNHTGMVPQFVQTPYGLVAVNPFQTVQQWPVNVSQYGVPQYGVSQFGLSHSQYGVPQYGVQQFGAPQFAQIPQWQMMPGFVPQVGVPQVGVPQVGVPQVGGFNHTTLVNPQHLVQHLVPNFVPNFVSNVVPSVATQTQTQGVI